MKLERRFGTIVMKHDGSFEENKHYSDGKGKRAPKEKTERPYKYEIKFRILKTRFWTRKILSLQTLNADRSTTIKDLIAFKHKIEEICESNQVSEIWAEDVVNEKLIKFLERIGFHITGADPGFRQTYTQLKLALEQ